MPRRSRLLRALLLERGISIDDALLTDVPRQMVALRQGLPYHGRLAVMAKPALVPGWVEFVSGALPDPLVGVSNQGSGAALLLEVDDRVLAFTFGRGRNLIDPAKIEDGFGLRVTLNAVDPAKVRAVDSRSFEDLVIHLSRQSSRNAELGSFAIDDSRDVLSAVAGVPRDATLGTRIAGSDGVAVSTDRTIEDLGELAHRLLELRADDAYKAAFGFIDQVRQVGSASLIERLDTALDRALENKLETVSMAPPQRVDYEDVAGYLYPHERRDVVNPHSDISLADYLVAIGGTTDVSRLKTDRVRLISATTEAAGPEWKAFNCIVFETRLDERAFVLSNGTWFEVAVDFVTDVEERLRHVPIRDLGLPEGRVNESETAYNRRAAGELTGAALLDIVPFRPRGARTPIEIADIAIGHRLVHIKRRTSSSTLSHLYAQGRTAAETLKADPSVRAALRTRLEAEGHPMADLLGGDRLTPGAIEITYVILTDHPATLPSGLPFFSKLNLVRSREYLENTLDFDVAASFVHQPD